MKRKVEDSNKGWWNERFRMKWPKNKEPSWHIDLVLAHKIIAPILYQHKHNIDLWRFHRMAAGDLCGHQFSFSFYTTPETAYQICNSLKSDALLKKMKRAGVIIEDLYDFSDKVVAPNIEDTSDTKWSAPIKKSWPYFIMGVCQMWLKLITEIAENLSAGKKLTSLPKLLAFYQKVNEAVIKSWQEEGGHALLHHLNAIFGYDPVLIYEWNLRRF
jgi:hypothetical protein